jgi:hypothetical protein
MNRFWEVINKVLILWYDPRLPRVLFIIAILLVASVSPLILIKIFSPDLPEAGDFIVQETEFGTEEPQETRIEDFVQPIETLVSTVLPTVQPSDEGDAGTPINGSDYSSTYVHEIVHLPGNRSMIRFVLTEGASGTYSATISDESDLRYQCFIPDGYDDRLYCYGPMLTNGKVATIKLFQIGDGSVEDEVVYEETILISISATLPIPYGGGFAWPDRFNDAEEQRKLTRLEWLYPLSISTTAFCVVGVLIAFYLRNRNQPPQLRTVLSPKSSTKINGRQTLTRDGLLRGINRGRVHITAVFIFCITGIIYLLTLSRTINSFDSAELITGAYTLGIVHSPGYPLYLIIANVISRIPFATVPLKVNAFSALAASSAVVLIFYAGMKLSNSLWSSALAASFVAFSRLVWSQAVLAEVYSLNLLLIACVSLAALVWNENPRTKTLLLLLFFFGLSLTHHPSALLLGPGILLLIIVKWRRNQLSWRPAFLALALFALPLMLYLYIPIRFQANPSLNYVGDYFNRNLTTIDGVLWMISGRMFAQEIFGRGLAEGLSQLMQLNINLWLNLFGGGAILTIIGFWTIRKHKGLSAFFIVSLSAILVFFAFYNVSDNAQMIAPTLVLIAPLLAIGLHRFSHLMLTPSRQSRLNLPVIQTIITLSTITILVATNWNYANRRDDAHAYSFAQQVMANVEENALILAQWTSATPLEYLQIVEGQRPDVEILDRGLLALGVRDRIAQLEFPLTPDYETIILSRIDEALQSRPVYVIEEDPIIMKHYCLEKTEPSIYRVKEWERLTSTCYNTASILKTYAAASR